MHSFPKLAVRVCVSSEASRADWPLRFFASRCHHRPVLSYVKNNWELPYCDFRVTHIVLSDFTKKLLSYLIFFKTAITIITLFFIHFLYCELHSYMQCNIKKGNLNKHMRKMYLICEMCRIIGLSDVMVETKQCWHLLLNCLFWRHISSY